MMESYTLHRLFEEQAARTPCALAVAAGEERLTYRELENRANRLARRLCRLGVGPEVRVGLCVERGAGMVAALLGILKAGGAWVALDPAYPRERLARMMEDAGVDILLAEPGTLGFVPAGGRRVVLLDSREGEERSEPLKPLGIPLDPENLAYLVFTSGSTGRPKGVALTHRSTVALVRWARETFTPAELAGVLASTSLGFDLSVFEIFAPLSVGGTVIVAADALELPSLPADPPVTLLNTVPSAGAELLRGRGIPPSVQVACFAGEPLPASLAEGVYRTTAVRRVLNLYGPSEDTVYSTAAVVAPGSPAPPIGRPIQGTRAHVDEEGELFLGGLGLARGYLGRPDATAERFVPDPWSGEPGARVYRTGDLVREGLDGELFFLGRADHQVKLRGFRIELGEIDAALLRHPGVREAVTVVRQGSLAAYVVLDEPAGAAELRSFLGRSLPEPMVPAAFHRLEALPRTLNGKVDRKALPETAEALPEEGDEVSPDLLAVLGALWAEALEVERVDPGADLFALGARAPQAAWVLARVRDLLGVALPERALASAPTVTGLARAVDTRLDTRLDAGPEPPLVRVVRGGALPLSLAQQRLWFLDRLRPGEPTYNEPAALDLRGPVSVPRLAAALSGLAARHEALRCRYGEQGGEPFQEVGPPVPVPLPVVDLGRFEEEVQRIAEAEVRRPFDLGRPPHLRALLIRGEGRHVLVLTVHHIAYDGRSRIVLFEELDALYAGRPLPPPGLQPADFAAWERRAWRGVPAGRLAPVLGRLLESEPLGLPADRARPEDPTSAGATLRFLLPPSQVARLRTLAREEGSSLFRLLLAAFAALLGRLAGRDRGNVGITAAHRPPGMEDAAGFFINLLPLPLDMSGSPTLRGLLARSRETVEAALALRDLPYQRLAAVRPGGDLFRVLFQMPRMPPLRLEGLEVAWRPVDTGTAKFDLETSLTEHGGALDGFCQYRADLYGHATMAAFAARFLALLESVDPDVPLEDHPALRDAERRQVAEPRRSRRLARQPEPSTTPATAAEERIAGIWAEVLGLESVGLRDNFFHLGGHSLLAARVLARIQETFGARLPVRALFQAPTVETLAGMVLAAEGADAPPLLAMPGPGPHPASFGQEALWLVTRMEPDGPLYNIPLAYRLRGALDRGALAQSVRETARRHEVLRSRFVEIEGRLAQEVAVPDLDVPWIDLSALPAAEPELERLLREEAAAPFDLSRGPLARARLVILGEEDHLLQVTAHHTAFDGWSQAVLEREISQIYAAQGEGAVGAREGGGSSPRGGGGLALGGGQEGGVPVIEDGGLRSAPLLASPRSQPPPPRGEEPTRPGSAVKVEPIGVAAPSPAQRGRAGEGVFQYADFARWQRERLTPGLLDRLLAYWRAELAGAPAVLDLATDRPRPEVRRARGACIRHPLPAGLAAQMRALSRAEGVTPFMVGLAAFQAQLHRATAQDDVLVGAPVASRHRPELEGLIGLFVDTVVLRGRFRGGDTFRELLVRTRETVLAAFAHQELPLGRLVAELRPERGASHNPLFQAMFALQNAPSGGLDLGLGATPVDPGPATAMFDLTLTLEEDRAVALEYDADLFDAATAESLVAGFLALLAGAVADPRRRISEITLAAPLPFEVRESRGGGSLLDRIASHDPEAVALVLGERAVTYGELDRESDLLAEQLSALGVGPEVVVGVSLERSPELVGALLGVWKAGGAYLPVDPALPAERRAFLLEDSGARVVVEGALPGDGAPAPALLRSSLRLPELPPSLPAAASGLAEASPRLPVLAPRLPEAVPSLPAASPGLPEASPSLPEAASSLPAISPGLPEAAPGLPGGFPNPLAAAPQRPGAAPALAEDLPYLPAAVPGPAEASLSRPAVLPSSPGVLPDLPAAAPRAQEAFPPPSAASPDLCRSLTCRPVASPPPSWPPPRANPPPPRGEEPPPSPAPTLAPMERAGEGSLAYLLYTSGSTGAPKPVGVTHAALNDHVLAAADLLELSERDRVLFFASPSFDVSLEELLPALVRGAAVVMRGPELWPPADFSAVAGDLGLTVADLPTAYWRQWVREARSAPPALRLVTVGGEAMPAEEARLWIQGPLARVRLLNAYGPTEAVITATSHAVAAVRSRVSLGRPLPGRRACVLDLYGQLQPAGVAGELCLGGTLARGYLKRPGLTAERFVPDPWSPEPGGRLYRTGDRARLLPDGTLEHLGRLDRQLKVRGIRIEPGEIEAALLRHPGVRETAVDLRPGPSGEPMLVAWIVAPSPISNLQSHLRALLPEALVPAAFVSVPALPLTSAGKVDLRALPDPEASASADAPRSPAEEVLAALWREVLGAEAGLDDSFFALGGHSLLAVRLLSRVREAFGVDLPVRALFAAPTIRGLAGAITSAGEGSLLPPLPSIPAGPRHGLAPLSFPQQRLWFLDRLQPGSAIYNVPVALRLVGPLDPAVLERSLDGVLRRHDALRTRFVEVDGQPWQEVLPPERFLLPEADLRALGPEARAAELARLGQEEVLRPFDLSRGPLLRALLVELDEGEHALLLTLHHIVSDAWSDEILERELSALYAGRPLPALPVQYADYARWQRSWPEAFLAAQLEHWKRRLDGLPTLELPTDRPRPPVQTFRGGVVRFEVPGETASALRLLSRRRGSTLFMTLLAAWQAVLGRLAGQTDLAVGTPVANRGRSEIEGLVGFFVNMLALRADLSGDPAFDELLGRVRRTALDAYAQQELPFERIVDELRLERDLSRQPLVQVMIAFQDEPAVLLDLPGLAARPLDLALPIAKFDLTLSLAGGEGGLPALLEHGADLFDRTTVQRLAGHLVHFLEQVAANPEAPLSGIGLLTPAERHQAALEWNDTAATFAEVSLIHQFFEARVDHRPGALAALWQGERITYGGLEERANRLAHLLRETGVGPGVAVGIWMERSLDLIAAVLGVLKAGGTYIPCDAAWPADRVEGILAATGARAALTRSALLPVVEELQQRLPELDHAVCLDLSDPEPPPEPLDPEAVRAVFDHVAERAVDRVTAGGFISGVTGLPFSEAEVDEYRDRVLALAGPWLRPGARVLEIGCGSGLLLWEMVERGCRCTGLDPSPLTQERNREHARRSGFEVELITGFAHEIGGLAGSFDLVLLASTIQFFPGRRYLKRVLDEALAKLVPGGAVLVADVPDPRHHARGKVLSVGEEWFRGLEAEVSVLRREEGFENELKNRYDVVLGAPSPALPRFAGEGVPAPRKHVWTAWHVERCSAGRLPVLASPESVAYVIHTSGSTGRPKGIAVQHRPVANLIEWLAPAFGVGPEDRVLFVTSLAFDLSVWDLFGMLAAGGSIHVASEEDLRDPEELVRVLRQEPVTIWDSAPAALAQLAPLFPDGPEAGSRLRLVMLSGDWIPVTLPDRVRSAFPGARVISLGGATEATVWSNWYPVAEVDPGWPSIPYGRPIANARYHVLDAAFDPCPIGIPGDLHIGGDCLCTGYAGQPDLTAASFLPDPFPAEPGARLYRTGDRARAFPDGNLEFLGRADHQVKIRGFRIEPGEIEATLVRHPGVREAAVVVREDVPGDKRLVAYLVAKVESEPLPVSDLQSHLRRTLPEAMIPSAFVLLDALPVTANGKLDRRALPAPLREGSGEAATTPAEERLLAIWREVLGIERIGIRDSFFDLGGHSLLATRLVSRLREAFGVEVHLRTLFQAPTVAGLATALETGASVSVEAPLVPVPRGGDLPLSASQLRQWFLVQLDPGDPAYTLPLSLELEGRLDPGRLARALAEIVGRHEALRTVFPARGGRPIAVVMPPAPVPLPRVDLSALPRALRDEEARRLEAEDRPFDLARGPLLRLVLMRLGEERHRLLLAVHHIVFDGWSFGVFTRELAALYGGEPLPDLPVQYADYAAWQREWLAGPAAEAQAESWKARLGGVSRILELPTDRPRPAVQSSRGALVPLDLPPALGRDLRAFAAREGVTLFMAGLAAWSALLARHAGQDGFNVGTFVANRRRAALERLLGLFVNTLALPVDLAGDPDWRSLLARVRESTLEAFEHQELPFERLLEALDLERDLSRTPLFQALFGVQNFALPSCEAGGVSFRPLSGAEHDRIPGDLALWIWEEGDGGISGWIKYAADLFDRATAIRLGRQLATLLAAALADPGASLSALPLLGDGERHQLLYEWGTGMPARAGEDRLTVPDRIALQAERAPHATAVEMGDEWLTYAELVRRADGLAAELRRRGAGPETVVGIAIERSPRQIVVLLAILRAGAAYLPLDPALPPARLARLVEESGARLVVASPAGAERLPDLRVETLVPDDSLVSAPGDEGPGLGDMAYVLFTSGSTGTPKGVMVEHGSLSRFVTTCLGLYGFAPGDRVLQFAPLSFDISVEEIFTSLVAGATLVLRDDEMIASPSHFLARCHDLGITVLDLPTAYGHELAPALAAGHPMPPMPPMAPILPALRLLIIAGERAQPGPLGDWLAAGGDRLTVLDTYGPTENTVVASACRLREGEALTIGRPIRGVEILVLDAGLGPVPPGVAGEVYLGGAGVCRGYLNRPDLTAERFLPAPGGERRYRTGDLARWLPDGRLDFVGRVDDQVKIRGFRIEPGEIAAVLSSHPGVEEAVVVARSTPAGPRLAAYATGSVEAAGLRAWLKERLPAYMVPPDLVLLDALPVTPSGKVDRRALPEPEGSSRKRAFAPPASPTEELLADLWKQLLGVEEVGLYEDFFDLGGHSLLAPQLLARIEETFEVDLPLRALFEAPTVAQMAVLLEDALLVQIEELSDEEAASLLEAG